MNAWVLKRQAVGLTIFSLLVFMLVVGGIVFYYSRVSCFDGILNGDEDGVDCGGSCERQCLGEIPNDPVLLWSRFFEVSQGVYDVGAMVENINLYTGTARALYTFELFDDRGVLLSKREGSTFISPNSRTFIYEPHLETAENVPSHVDFRLVIPQWERISDEDGLNIEVLSKRFTNNPAPVVEVLLSNHSLFEEPKIEVTVLLEGKNGNIYAASRTVIENMPGNAERLAVFTWPSSQFDEPDSISVLLRRFLQP